MLGDSGEVLLRMLHGALKRILPVPGPEGNGEVLSGAFALDHIDEVPALVSDPRPFRRLDEVDPQSSFRDLGDFVVIKVRVCKGVSGSLGPSTRCASPEDLLRFAHVCVVAKPSGSNGLRL